MLGAAVDLFTEHGIGATSMATIAKRAGVGLSSIYLHFASKEALVDAIVGDALMRHETAFSRAEGFGPLAELQAFGEAFVAFAAAEPAAARAISVYGTEPDRESGTAAQGFLDGAVDRVEAVVRELIAEDRLGASDRPAATALMVAVILGLGDQVSRTDGLGIHVDVAQAALGLVARSPSARGS
ncbi:MAG: TetR/AcrR family transcriptional regulator [Solirubrobacteraceae bacterium]|nr:TetR/AcrR family transcriptional regulator [Solirubrobacteraceae bacterium]